MIQRIGILGSGSIGCYIGGHLLAAGNNVLFIGRERLQKEIKASGMTLTDFTGKKIFIEPNKINYLTNIDSLADCDLIIVTVKSQDSEISALDLKKVFGENKNKVLISFQNGVTNAKRINKILTESRVLAGMVPYNVLSKGSGVFHSGTSGKLLIQKDSIISDEIISIFQKSGLEIESHINMEGILWGKLIFNLNNAINALAGVPLKEELSNPKFRRILAATMNESLTILKKSGITPVSLGKMIPWLAPIILKLPNFLFFKVASSMVKIDPEARSSMWEDLDKKRKVEFDFINGEIISLAKSNNLNCPIQTGIAGLIKDAEEKKLGSPRYTAEKLSELLSIT